ncbi:MAG: PH domain-containing protein [Candidatus Thorarchaeota archaeon]
MVEDDGRVIRPPIEQIISGRVFQPSNAFIGKKVLKVGIGLVLIWGLLLIIFSGLTDPIIGEILRAAWQPLELLNILGWEMINYFYLIIVAVTLLVGTIYLIIYVKRIDYSVLDQAGEPLPEIYTKRGIVTITKQYQPFRTITRVQTRRGFFDRIFGIGTVLIETAGGKASPQATGLLPLILQKLGGESSGERVEGIKFHEELRDYVLREMREIGSAQTREEHGKLPRKRKRIFTTLTLETFKEVRDALRESQTPSLR